MPLISARKSRGSVLPETPSCQNRSAPTLSASTIQAPSTLEYINFHKENSVLYEVENEISSSATKVFFVHGPCPYTQIQLCLKVWEPCDNGLYSTRNLVKCTEYLLEGLDFNRQFAEDVHLGIAPVETLDKNFIKCGKLIVNPDKDVLEKDVRYALVMRRLEQNWRLDHQLTQDTLGTENGIEFLAHEIVHMHQKLTGSPDNIGGDKSILSKLRLNRGHFEDALQIFYDKQIDIEKYKQITKLMDEAYEKHKKLFQKRSQDHRIKRCHGDLKTANLWVCPSRDGKNEEKQLLVLDCVDFNPEFCNIDTISDVAMLAIDIEMHLPNWLDESENTHHAKKPSEHFLDTYLGAMSEKKRKIKNILQYYLTEKAMIYTYMSVKFDEHDECNDDNGKKYLDLALSNALKLTSPSRFSVYRPIAQYFISLARKLVGQLANSLPCSVERR